MYISRVVFGASAMLVFFAGQAQANAATIMDFPDNAALKGRAEVVAYAFRSAPPIARQCAGKSNGGSITVTKPVDAMSPQLAQAAQAKSAITMQIDDSKADGTRVAYQMTNATISSVTPKAGGDKPVEQVAFSYSNIQWVTVGCKPNAAAQRRNAMPSLGDGGAGAGGYRY